MLEVDGQLVAEPTRRAEAGDLAAGRTIGASPVLIAFVRKMSPNDGRDHDPKP